MILGCSLKGRRRDHTQVRGVRFLFVYSYTSYLKSDTSLKYQLVLTRLDDPQVPPPSRGVSASAPTAAATQSGNNVLGLRYMILDTS